MSGEIAHTRRKLPELGGVLYLAHQPPKRLVVFVHGFLGKAASTWLDFPEGDIYDDWWKSADMLYVGYDSLRDGVTGVASRINRELPRFYPHLNQDMLRVGDEEIRGASLEPYEELVVAAHSLGGVIVRRAIGEAAQSWIDRGKPDHGRPPLLDAKLRLFSPAIFGFRAAGLLGAARATGIWRAIDLFLRRASAYSDIQSGSDVLRSIQRRTEQLALVPGCASLKAHILWANPEDVVIAERYDVDYADTSIDGRTHTDVCKPQSGVYDAPRHFVKTGSAW